jgi:hypothetical protein
VQRNEAQAICVVRYLFVQSQLFSAASALRRLQVRTSDERHEEQTHVDLYLGFRHRFPLPFTVVVTVTDHITGVILVLICGYEPGREAVFTQSGSKHRNKDMAV